MTRSHDEFAQIFKDRFIDDTMTEDQKEGARKVFKWMWEQIQVVHNNTYANTMEACDNLMHEAYHTRLPNHPPRPEIDFKKKL